MTAIVLLLGSHIKERGATNSPITVYGEYSLISAQGEIVCFPNSTQHRGRGLLTFTCADVKTSYLKNRQSQPQDEDDLELVVERQPVATITKNHYLQEHIRFRGYKHELSQVLNRGTKENLIGSPCQRVSCTTPTTTGYSGVTPPYTSHPLIQMNDPLTPNKKDPIILPGEENVCHHLQCLE